MTSMIFATCHPPQYDVEALK